MHMCAGTRKPPMNPRQMLLDQALLRAAVTATQLQHSATLCNALQRSATLCNTLQRFAALCNTLIQPIACGVACPQPQISIEILVF